MIRRIGRRDSERSPVSVVTNGCAATTPASMRIVLPELPQSSVSVGACSPRTPRPAMRTSGRLIVGELPLDADAERGQARRASTRSRRRARSWR